MKNIKLILAMFIGFIGFAQENSENTYQNSGKKLLNDNLSKDITIGGYAQIDYNEPDGSEVGKLDVHRLVLLFGYQFFLINQLLTLSKLLEQLHCGIRFEKR